MNLPLDWSNSWWTWLARASWQASVLVLLVLGAQWLFRRQLGARWRGWLWWLVVIRLALPVTPGSSFSIFNWIGWGHKRPPGQNQAAKPLLPAMRTGLPSPLGAKPAEGIAPASAAVAGPVQTRPEGGADSSPAARPESVPPSGLSWLRALIWLWGIGVAALLAQLGRSLVRLRRVVRSASFIRDPAILRLFDECRGSMDVGRQIPVLETPLVATPALCGLFRPRLLLPPGLLGSLAKNELRFVFLHELAHLKRGDLFANWVAAVLQVVHWGNPLVWLAFARMRADRELACDALALAQAQPEERRAYGRTILKLVEGLGRPAPLPMLVGILEDRGQLKRRIAMIADSKRPPRWSLVPFLLLGGLALVSLTDARTPRAAAKDGPVPVVADSLPAGQTTNSVPGSVKGLSLTTMSEGASPSGVFPGPTRKSVVERPGADAGTGKSSSTSNSMTQERQWAERIALSERLARIKLDSVAFDAVPLSEAVKMLSEAAHHQDPKGGGVNFVLSETRSSTNAIPLALVTVRVQPPLTNTTLLKALAVMAESADPPIKFSVEQHGAVFSFRGADSPVLLAPPQVTIEVKYVEITQEDHGFDFHVGNLSFGTNSAQPAPVTADPQTGIPGHGTNRLVAATSPTMLPGADGRQVAKAKMTGILTPQQFRSVLKALEQQKGTDVLSAPQVTTLSGRQAQLKAVDVRYIVTGLQTNTQPGGNPMPISEPIECGPTLDVVPQVGADGYTIHLVVIPTVREFLGYDEDGKRFKSGSTPYPLPKFRLRQVSASATLWDGQTLVLSAGTTEDTITSRNGLARTSKKVRKNLLIFVTPTIIDPAGNPVHTAKEMPFRENGAPEQKGP
jgi:beta-lactamase regulating signal transducer with metallopeptidase domain